MTQPINSRVTPQHVRDVQRWFSHRAHQPGVIPVDPDDRAAWLVARTQGLGGSDAAAIAGLSGYQGALAVYLDKKGLIPDDAEEDPTLAEAARWGHILEEVVAHEYIERQRRAGKRVSNVTKPGVMFRHPLHPWMLATPDRLVFDWNEKGDDVDLARGLEIKTRSAHVARQWQDGQIPQSVLAQVQWYMEVLGLDEYDVAALVGGQALTIGRVTRDQTFINRLVAAGGAFWDQCVVPGSPPPADGLEGTTWAIKAAYRTSTPDKVAQLEPATFDRLGRYMALTKYISRATKEKEAIANDLRVLLGDAEEGHYQDQRVITWRAGGPRHTIDVERLERDWPVVWAAVKTESPGSRTLRVRAVSDQAELQDDEFDYEEE